jgi:hypothetical protein
VGAIDLGLQLIRPLPLAFQLLVAGVEVFLAFGEFGFESRYFAILPAHALLQSVDLADPVHDVLC